NTIGVKNALGLLVETRQIPLSGEEQNDPAVNNRRRVDSHLVAVQATLRMLVEHRAEIERATTEARLAGLRNEGPVYFGGADNEPPAPGEDRKSTRLNSSHVKISYAVFCLKKK